MRGTDGIIRIAFGQTGTTWKEKNGWDLVRVVLQQPRGVTSSLGLLTLVFWSSWHVRFSPGLMTIPIKIIQLFCFSVSKPPLGITLISQANNSEEYSYLSATISLSVISVFWWVIRSHWEVCLGWNGLLIPKGLPGLADEKSFFKYTRNQGPSPGSPETQMLWFWCPGGQPANSFT